MKKYPVVVLRASDNCFLDVLRCFAKEDVPVIPVVFTWEGASPWISEQSKYYKEPIVIKNPATDEMEALEQMIALGEDVLKKYGRKLLLIATSDTALVFINRHYDILGKYFLQQGSKDFNGECWKELRKDTFYQAMKEHNVSIPLTYPVNTEADICDVADKMVYPCVYKPSWKTIDNAFQRLHDGKKAVECENKEILINRLKEEVKLGFEVVVQEKIEFEQLEEEVSCYLYADVDGNIRMISAQHKIMEFPKKYGTGVASRTFFKEELAALAIEVIKALDWHGFLGVETMYSKKHGKWVVIEANLRPWLSNYFQAAVGYNYLTMLYRDAMGELEPYTTTIKPDNCEVFRVNLTAFIKKCVFECGDEERGIQQVLAFMKEHEGNIVFSYAVPQDPAPGYYELETLKKNYPGHDELFDSIEQIMFLK